MMRERTVIEEEDCDTAEEEVQRRLTAMRLLTGLDAVQTQMEKARSDLNALHALLTQQGWTWLTAVCAMLFSLMHWPCSTACLTVKKESGSWKWTLAAFVLPTAAGTVICLLVAAAARLLGLA